MDELIEQFALEARELVQQASDDLLALEQSPSDRERLESVFRAVHTLKGSVGLFDFGPMQGVLHRAEDLLSQARGGAIVVNPALVDTLLAVIGWVDGSIEGIMETGRLLETQEAQAPRLLRQLTRETTERETAGDVGEINAVPDWAVLLRRHLPPGHGDGDLVAIHYEPHPECFFNGDDPLAMISRLPNVLHLEISLKEPSPSARDYDPFRCDMVIEAVCSGPPGEIQALFRLIPDQVIVVPLKKEVEQSPSSESGLFSGRGAGRQTTTMRVDSARIDTLIEIAGELITAKNGLAPLAEEAGKSGNRALARRIGSSHQEIERLVASLYSAVTRARMVPLEQTFRRFPRLVRETAAKLGKAVDLIIDGETVEADREIVENLFEPLLHLVRNSLDHGIEPGAERLLAFKPARGRLLLRAQKRGDQIEIELKDDGRGMQTEHIRQRAIDSGLIPAIEASALSERDMFQLVFAAGFSTASSVSELSGRGVGLDVVRRSVERLGGTLGMQSTPEVGMSFVLKLPISFSMTQLMVVEVGNERYGIPISDVVETHKLPANAVQSVRGNHAFILRDRTVPLLYLSDLLQLAKKWPSSEDLKVLIVRMGDDLIGVAVDAIAERAETLTRPLSGLLQGVAGVSGTTLLGDGKVLLVLDIEELMQ
ncbi:chemotaxis protein CheA [Rhizobium sp. VS19-DR104.2]|uniref:chemotaxis protein CheA n=1 Tax=unclassified Rhizobium TaxID=2613769 RepID=UPI001C5A6EB2|nr:MULTISPECIES: chemotaxis protein CheA [unclassified Rhizobium]MBZ5763082.1 chemotaxis protein CheA [Rhizobium sp. VS19-DR96]MBZ5768958.1 chemotaxis protein CheA [Rhizobium sp. VS19-DR129.2]MBZ5776576.1 chemotaxis protein CheA [Rhizobium sp. VS19-DRK62.2]MBZ5787685.1 chemotaxis protein CheA [Rhizobium sp. VS19-DR121]MBZ5805058.1 chemotaxis protein CheA [Rhizobium sp. VS19-DR181]